ADAAVAPARPLGAAAAAGRLLAGTGEFLSTRPHGEIAMPHRHAVLRSILCLVAATAGLAGTGAAHAEEGSVADLLPTVGSIERLDPRFDTLVPKDAVIEVLASGFIWAEGPVWLKQEQAVLFSDIPRNRVMRYKDSEGLSVYLEPAGFTGPSTYGSERGSNGLTLDRQGNLISCEHGDRRVSRLTPGGGKRTVADNYRGKRFNSPNDCAVHSSGAIYFTDPPYGLPKGWDDERRELDFCGVYRVTADGTVTLLCDTMTRPNGIAFSPDEKKLYVAQSDPQAPIWRVFNVKSDGTLDEGKTFFDATALFKARKKGLPDGLKVDRAGNVFATGPGGVLVFSAEGTHLGTLLTGQATANCGFGEDGKTLFMTADSHLCRVRLTTTGPIPGP
ncbi:MAG: SMP-30/gluconolactonase/LRE family protein, partial [Planctomycetia bacterium]